MGMVIVWHFIVRCLIDVPGGACVSMQVFDNYGFVGGGVIILLCSLLCVAVNLFVLISGYWGIKLSSKSMLRLWLLCTFYSLAALLINTPFSEIGLKSIVKCFLITRTDNWFFPAYFWLMFFAPICNNYLRVTELSKLRVLMALLLVLNVFSGFVLNYRANGNGYTVIHLMLIYIIGGYLRRENISLSSQSCLCWYGLISLANAGICWLMIKHSDINGMKLFDYNNPLIIVNSVLVFLTFKNMKIQSNAINKIARTVVAVLLIQDVVLRETMIRSLKECLVDGWLSFLSTAAIWFIFFFIAAYIIEMVRMPLADRIIKMVKRCLPRKLADMQL